MFLQDLTRKPDGSDLLMSYGGVTTHLPTNVLVLAKGRHVSSQPSCKIFEVPMRLGSTFVLCDVPHSFENTLPIQLRLHTRSLGQVAP